jgi:hypothetical protein
MKLQSAVFLFAVSLAAAQTECYNQYVDSHLKFQGSANFPLEPILKEALGTTVTAGQTASAMVIT